MEVIEILEIPPEVKLCLQYSCSLVSIILLLFCFKKMIVVIVTREPAHTGSTANHPAEGGGDEVGGANGRLQRGNESVCVH